MIPMTATEKKNFRAGAGMKQTRPMIESHARHVYATLEEQRAYVARMKESLREAEQVLAILEQNSAFFSEILSEVRL